MPHGERGGGHGHGKCRNKQASDRHLATPVVRAGPLGASLTVTHRRKLRERLPGRRFQRRQLPIVRARIRCLFTAGEHVIQLSGTVRAAARLQPAGDLRTSERGRRTLQVTAHVAFDRGCDVGRRPRAFDGLLGAAKPLLNGATQQTG